MSRSTRQKVTKELLERVIAREVQAQREWYSLLQAVFRVRIVKELLPTGHCTPQAVADVAHDTFVALLDDDARLIRAWDPERASFETYSGLIAQQRAIEYARKKKEALVWSDEPPEQAEDSSRSPERVVASQELLEKIFTILQKELDAQGCRVFELLYKERREVNEICTLLNMTEAAVYAWRSRLGRRIQEIASTIRGAEWA